MIRKKSRAAAYCRFSSSNQREESIDAQLRAIYKYMGEHDYTPVGDYIDMALTGTNTDRPNFQRMIEDAKKGLVDILLLIGFRYKVLQQMPLEYNRHLLH